MKVCFVLTIFFVSFYLKFQQQSYRKEHLSFADYKLKFFSASVLSTFFKITTNSNKCSEEMQFQIPHNNHKILFQQDAVKSPLLEFYQFSKENQRKIEILDIEGTCIFKSQVGRKWSKLEARKSYVYVWSVQVQNVVLIFLSKLFNFLASNLKLFHSTWL